MSDQKKSEPKKVFDVRRPGKAPASATSRPVITGHKPPIKDLDFSEKPKLLGHKLKVTIEPAAPPAPKPEAEEKRVAPRMPSAPPLPADQSSPSKNDTALAGEKEKSVPQGKTEQPSKSLVVKAERAAEATDIGKAAVDSSVRQPSPAELAQQPAVAQETLPSSEPLHMDIPSSFSGKIVVSHHGRRRMFWLELLSGLLIVLLLATIANFLLDAEIIKTELDLPHTDLF